MNSYRVMLERAVPAAAIFTALGVHFALHIDTIGVSGPVLSFVGPLWWFAAAACVLIGGRRRSLRLLTAACTFAGVGTTLASFVELVLLIATALGEHAFTCDAGSVRCHALTTHALLVELFGWTVLAAFGTILAILAAIHDSSPVE